MIEDYIKKHITEAVSKLPEIYRGLAKVAAQHAYSHDQKALSVGLKHLDGSEITAKWDRIRVGDFDYFQLKIVIATNYQTHVKKQ